MQTSSSERQQNALKRIQSIRSNLLSVTPSSPLHCPAGSSVNDKSREADGMSYPTVQELLEKNNRLMQALIESSAAVKATTNRSGVEENLDSSILRVSVIQLLEEAIGLDDSLFPDLQKGDVAHMTTERLSQSLEKLKELLSQLSLMMRRYEQSAGTANHNASYGERILDISQRLENANARLKKETTDRDATIKLLQENESSLRQTVEELLDEKLTLAEKFKSEEEKRKSLEMDVTVLVNKCRELQEEGQQRESAEESAKHLAEIEALKIQNGEQKEETEALLRKLDEIAASNEDDLGKLQNELAEVKQELSRCQADLEGATKQCEELKVQNEALQGMLANVGSNKENSHEELVKQSEDAQRELTQCQEDLLKLQTEFEQLTEENTRLQNTFDTEQARNESDKESLQKELEQAKKKVGDSQEELKTLSEQVENLSREKQELEHQLENDHSTSAAASGQQQKELAEVKARLLASLAEITDIKKQCADVTKENDKLQEVIQNLDKELTAAQAQIKQAETANSELSKGQHRKSSTDSAASDLESANKKINELKAVIESMTRDMSTGDATAAVPPREVDPFEYLNFALRDDEFPEVIDLGDWLHNGCVPITEEFSDDELNIAGFYYETWMNILGCNYFANSVKEWRILVVRIQTVLDKEGGGPANALGADCAQIFFSACNKMNLLANLTEEEKCICFLTCLCIPLSVVYSREECTKLLTRLLGEIAPERDAISTLLGRPCSTASEETVTLLLNSFPGCGGSLFELFVSSCRPEFDAASLPLSAAPLLFPRLALILAGFRNPHAYGPLLQTGGAVLEVGLKRTYCEMVVVAMTLCRVVAEPAVDQIGDLAVRAGEVLNEAYNTIDVLSRSDLLRLLKSEGNVVDTAEGMITVPKAAFCATQQELLHLYQENSKYNKQLIELVSQIESIEQA